MTTTGNDLGSCIRQWRARLTPESAGLPATGSARRTPGLRREELAALASVSVDYLVRLEQGRAANPSAEVLASLTRALRLTREERDHLFRLAGKEPPGPGQIAAVLTPGLLRLIGHLDDAAVGVYDAAWNLLTWNRTWAALMGDPSSLAGRDRNLLWRHFTGHPSRVVRSADETAQWEQSAVADLRMAAARYPADDGVQRLIADLRRASDRFANAWEQHRVAAHQADRKTIDHPEAGPLTVDCDVLAVEGSALRIVVYTADPGSADADRLDLVRVVGTQDLGAGEESQRSVQDKGL